MKLTNKHTLMSITWLMVYELKDRYIVSAAKSIILSGANPYKVKFFLLWRAYLLEGGDNTSRKSDSF